MQDVMSPMERNYYHCKWDCEIYNSDSAKKRRRVSWEMGINAALRCLSRLNMSARQGKLA